MKELDIVLAIGSVVFVLAAFIAIAVLVIAAVEYSRQTLPKK